MPTLTIKIIVGILLLFSSAISFAMPFTNGDFSSNSDWVDASVTGSASIIGGQAQLDTGDGADPYSAVFIQGDDGFFNFSDPILLGASDNYLNFDVEFFDLGVDGTETVGPLFSDHLDVVLYDMLDFNLDLPIDPSVDANLIGLHTLSFDVSSLAGREVALSFELSDENDGRNSRVILDNINFTATRPSATVPEPGMLALVVSGLMVMQINNRRRTKSSHSDKEF